MKIILAGIIGRYPVGGVAWCGLMYLLGLRALGHDVYYLEDTGECNYDPERNEPALEPDFALRYLADTLAPFGFGDRWRYIDYRDRAYGMSDARWRAVCAAADLFLVVSGGCWRWRDEYTRIPRKVFIDTDPAFTQLALDAAARHDDERSRWYVDFFRAYDRLFTFGAHIGTERCAAPTAGFDWLPTVQPIDVDLWRPPAGPLPPRAVWTTVMTWKIKSFTDIGGNKDREFMPVLELARRCRARGGPELELAVNGPLALLREHGWRCVDAYAVSADPWRYHAYIRASRGEFSVAKHTYVKSGCGWFSDRTACYLAAGRPAVVQDTGFSATLPCGRGLLAWRDADEALAALERVEADYAAHQRAARELAVAYFAAPGVLTALLDRCA